MQYMVSNEYTYLCCAYQSKKGASVKVTMYTLGLCLEILFRLFVRSMLWSENYSQQESKDYFLVD